MYLKTIYIGSDHAGLKLKGTLVKHLSEKGYDVKDLGPLMYDPKDNYPDYAVKVSRKVLQYNTRGILVSGSGQEMDRAANKIPGIHASVCWDKESAILAKKHGNANMLCLGESFLTPESANEIAKTWLEEPFGEELSHIRNIKKVKELEANPKSKL